MPIYKDKKNGTWYAMVRYKDWTEQISRSAKEDLKQSVRRRNGSISLSSKEKLILI